VIDLDLPPNQRFVESSKHFRLDILNAFDAFEAQIPKQVIAFFEKSSWTWKYAQTEKY